MINFEYAEFYKQLALLTKARLPLPEALRFLSADFGDRRTKEILSSFANRVSGGIPLSKALSERPDLFSPLTVRMVELGESGGGLPEVLEELYMLSIHKRSLSGMIRDIMFYPLLTVLAALLLFVGLMIYVVPGLMPVFNDLNVWISIPWLTRMVLEISGFVNGNIVLVSVFTVLVVLFMLSLLRTSAWSDRIVSVIAAHIPCSEIIFYNFSMARLCSIWAVMMRRKFPADESLRSLALIMDFPPLSEALARVAGRLERGEDLKRCLLDEEVVSRLLPMTLENSAGEALPDELTSLAGMFRERGMYGFRKVGMVWECMAFVAMVLVSVLFIMALFAPFFTMITKI